MDIVLASVTHLADHQSLWRQTSQSLARTNRSPPTWWGSWGTTPATKQGSHCHTRVRVRTLTQRNCFHCLRPPRAHTQRSALPPGENKHLIKQFRCASAEVDYMYLAQIIISGSHVHCNYREHLCLAHLLSLPRMPSSNLSVIISTGEKGNIQQQYNSITLLLKMLLRFHRERKKRCLNRIPGIMNYQKLPHETI